MSDETVTWTEADKAELLDEIVKAACKCDYGLCAVCDAMVYGGDQVDVIVGARDRDIEYWRERALAAEAKVRELTPAPPDQIPFFGDYPGAYEATFGDDAVVIPAGRPITKADIERASTVLKRYDRSNFLLTEQDVKNLQKKQ